MGYFDYLGTGLMKMGTDGYLNLTGSLLENQANLSPSGIFDIYDEQDELVATLNSSGQLSIKGEVYIVEQDGYPKNRHEICAVVNNEEFHKLSFDVRGNFVIEDDLVPGATEDQLTTDSEDLWVLVNSSNEVVARVAKESYSGNLYSYVGNSEIVDIDYDMDVYPLYLKGAFCELQTNLDATNALYVQHDYHGNPVAVIDEQGNLKITGRAFIGERPDRKSSQGDYPTHCFSSVEEF